MAKAKKTTSKKVQDKEIIVDSIAEEQKEQSGEAAPEAPPTEPEEMSEHEQELNKRIDPSQPMTDPPQPSSDVEEGKQGESAGLESGVLDRLSEFAAFYPNNKVFHFTSDNQMFLDKNKRDAEMHEKHIGGKGVKSYSVD